MTTKLNFAAITTSSNILNHFRSYNCIWTLSAARSTSLGPPADLQALDQDLSNPNFVIAKSGGKGPNFTKITTNDNGSISKEAQQQTGLFSGQYDFYFDDVEIEALPAFDSRTGYSKSTKISFTLHEPYGIGGFIEALQASAVQANNSDYRSSIFVLRLQFNGYPEDDDSTPITPGIFGTRYFPLVFTSIEVKIDQAGTVYHCKAVPANELSFADANKLTANVNVQGTTVGDIIKNLFISLNETSKKQRFNVTQDPNDINYDEYRIKFATLNSDGTVTIPPGMNLDDTGSNPFSLSKTVPDPEKNNYDYQYYQPDESGVSNKGTITNAGATKLPALTQAQLAAIQANPSLANTEASRSPTLAQLKQSIPTDPIVQFSGKANIHDCISAVVRDCDLIQKTLIALAGSDPNSVLDSQDMVTYFYITIQVADKEGTYDPISGLPAKIHTYILMPYKMHISRFPQFQNVPLRPGSLQKRIRRTYDYLYTGKNTDILSFDLKFNNLYFQTRPINSGASDVNNAANALQPDGNPLLPPEKYQVAENIVQRRSGATQIRTRNALNSQYVGYGGDATRGFNASVWSAVAKNVHHELLDDVGMFSVEIEIVGDPYYILQGGVGNIITTPDPKNLGITTIGEADHQSSEVYVQINVANITDMNVQTGLAIKDTAPAFSGIYRLIHITNYFQGGVFKQRLKLIRMPEQNNDVNPWNQNGWGEG